MKTSKKSGKSGKPSNKPADPKTDDPQHKRAVQTEIPGTERPRIKAIDEASELYVNLRDRMQTAVKKFKEEGKSPLIELIHRHADKIGRNSDNEIVYRYDDMEVRLTPKDEVLKVRHVEGDEITVGTAPSDDSEGTA